MLIITKRGILALATNPEEKVAGFMGLGNDLLRRTTITAKQLRQVLEIAIKDFAEDRGREGEIK